MWEEIWAKVRIVLEEQTAFVVTFTEKFILFLVIMLIAVFLSKLAKRFLEHHFNKASKHIHVDVTRYRFFKHSVSAIIYVLGFGLAIYSIPALRTISVSLFAGAGILAIVIGFAAQQTFANIVSGVMITISKPFRVGDRVKIGTDMRGIVEDITLRHTVIKDFENKRIIIPNSVMGNEIIENSSLEDPKIVAIIDIGIAYDADLDKAMKIVEQEGQKHPDCLDNRTEKAKKEKAPIVAVRVIGFGESSVNLRAWVWAKDQLTAFRMRTDLNRSIKLRFDKESIEIPFPYRTIVYKKDLAKPKKHSVKKKTAKKVSRKKKR